MTCSKRPRRAKTPPAPPCSCLDCGIDTFPVGTGRPGRAEWYIVADPVWSAAGMIVAHVPEAYGQFLCIGCLEARIGRQLNTDDFPDLPINDASHADDPCHAYTFRTPRLVARMVSNPALT
jgi:hypothetical protein